MTLRVLDPHGAEYTTSYNAGWRAGLSYTEVGGLNPTQRADRRNVPDAWYDGYADADLGRPKWSARTARRRGHGNVEPEDFGNLA